MGDRVRGFVITLEEDINDEDAEALAEAVRCFRYVASVDSVVADFEALMARQQAKYQLRDKIIKIIT